MESLVQSRQDLVARVEWSEASVYMRLRCWRLLAEAALEENNEAVFDRAASVVLRYEAMLEGREDPCRLTY